MQDYALLQEALEGMSKKDAVEHLVFLFPHKAKAWFTRNFGYIMALDPAGLHEVLVYNDPTARKAINNVMRERVAA